MGFLRVRCGGLPAAGCAVAEIHIERAFGLTGVPALFFVLVIVTSSRTRCCGGDVTDGLRAVNGAIPRPLQLTQSL